MSTQDTENNPSRPLLLFLHLPKTAGTTMAHIIKRQYGFDRVLALYDSFFGEEIAAIPECQKARLAVVMGHFYFGAHKFISRPCTYITILRAPISRVISHYSFARSDPTHPLYTLSHEMSLSEFVTSCGLTEPNNDQTRLLAGIYNSSNFGIGTEDMLPVAKMNLSHHFAVVGLKEEFDRTLLLIKKVMGWSNPYYIRKNVSQKRARKGDIPPETIKVIQDHNQLDIELYAYAKELFKEKVDSFGDMFERELHTFKIMNSLYGKLLQFKASVKGL